MGAEREPERSGLSWSCTRGIPDADAAPGSLTLAVSRRWSGSTTRRRRWPRAPGRGASSTSATPPMRGRFATHVDVVTATTGAGPLGGADAECRW